MFLTFANQPDYLGKYDRSQHQTGRLLDVREEDTETELGRIRERLQESRLRTSQGKPFFLMMFSMISQPSDIAAGPRAAFR